MRSVLIVDDNPLIRRLLRAALTESEWIVCEEAENGREGIVVAMDRRVGRDKDQNTAFIVGFCAQAPAQCLSSYRSCSECNDSDWMNHT